MIEHKAYECEFCGKEFDDDEYESALYHEKNCDCNPIYKKCASCKNGKGVVSYETEYIRCDRLRDPSSSCGEWDRKKEC